MFIYCQSLSSIPLSISLSIKFPKLCPTLTIWFGFKQNLVGVNNLKYKKIKIKFAIEQENNN